MAANERELSAGSTFYLARQSKALARQPEQRQIEVDVLAKISRDAHILGQQTHAKPVANFPVISHDP